MFDLEKIEKPDVKEFTCNECKANKTCPFAWDWYNTNGDCLAEK